MMISTKPVPFLEGHTIFLRPIEKKDMLNGEWHNWYNNYRLTEFNSHGVYPINMEDQEGFYEQQKGSMSNISLAICSRGDDALLGNVSLTEIDLLNRKAQIVLTVGKNATNTVGLEAMGLIIQHGFVRLNLNKVWAGAHEGLEDWVKMLSVLGFEEEGRLRAEFLRNGQFSDAIRFSVLKADYQYLLEQRSGQYLYSSSGALFGNAIRHIKPKKQKAWL